MDARLIVKRAGGPQKVGLALGISKGAVSQWRVVPIEHVLKIAELSGWEQTPHEISPSFYPHPQDGLPEHLRSAA